MGKMCPNSKNWLHHVDKLGIFEANRLFIANGYDVPKFSFKTSEEAFTYFSNLPQVSKLKGRLYIAYGKDKLSWTINTNLINQEKDRINDIYGKGFIVLRVTDVKKVPNAKFKDPTPSRTRIDEILINKAVLKKYYSVYKKENEREFKKEAEDQGRMYKPDYEQRVSKSDKLSPENREDFEKKKNKMLKSFPRVNSVIEDYNMPQAGVLEANGTIIRVNPNLWTTDTIGHEFGHLLIDLIGGLENPIVKRARKQLIGTKLEQNVKDKYPDLVKAADGRIDKEIVAQSIGEQTSIIFKTEESRANWRNILSRLLDRVKKILHINHSSSKELARIVLSGYSVNKNMQIPVGFAESRVDDILGKDKKKEQPLDELQALKEKFHKAMLAKQEIYSKKGATTKLDTLNTLLQDIELLEENPIEAIAKFQKFALEQTKLVYDRYAVGKLRADKARRGESGGKAFTVRELSTWKDYVEGFAMLDDLAKYAEAVEINTSHKETGIEAILDKDKLSEAMRMRETIMDAYKKEGIPLVAKFLTKHSKHIQAKVRTALEEDYYMLSKEERSLKSKETYLYEQLRDKKKSILSTTESLIIEELSKVTNDVSYLTRWLDNLLDSHDLVVSAMATAVQKADFAIRNESLQLQDEMLSLVKDLESFYSSKVGIFKDIKDIYSFMLEKDSKGNNTQHIITPHLSKLWADYQEYNKKLMAEDYTLAVVKAKLKQWKTDNMPVNNLEFKMAKSKFFEKLIANKEITRKQWWAIDANNRMDVADPVDLSEIVGEEMAKKINSWIVENISFYRRADAKYRNPQWEELVKIAGGNSSMNIEEQLSIIAENKNKDPRIAFYNYIIKKNREASSNVTHSHRLFTQLPSVLKSTGERLTAGSSLLSVTKHSLQEGFNVLSDEDDRGGEIITDEANKPVHFIPVFYTKNLKEVYKKEYDKLSKDKKKNITEKEYIQSKAEENQSYDLATIYTKYYSSVINYKHKQEILPEMELAKFLVENREIAAKDGKGNLLKDKLGKLVPQTTNKTAEQLNDFFEAQLYGIKEKDQGTMFGGRIDKQKAAGLLNKFTAINLLGLNFVQGVANITLGKAMQIIEAAGGEFYGKKDLGKANLLYTKNLPGILADVGSRKPSNKISLLLRKFDILNEYKHLEYRKNSKFRQLMGVDRLFLFSEAGEHLVQTQVLLAMLIRKQAVNEAGEQIGSMLDFISVKEGKLIISKKVKNFSIEEQAEFEHSVRRVLSPLHGEYGELGRVAIQRMALGKMGYMFRKFVIPGFNRRFSKLHVNNGLGREVEGAYISTGRFLKDLGKDLSRLRFSLMTEDWNKMSDMRKANVRKTLVEVGFLITTMILANVFLGMKEGADDEDEEWYYSFLAYQALRFKTELGFFINPMEAAKILRSPAASMSMIENSLTLIGQMLPPSFKGFEEYQRGSWKGKKKITKTIVNFTPGLKQWYRYQNIEDQISWIK